MIDAQRTLWFNGDRTRFFLISNDQELPSGDFLLRRGVSYQMQVDELDLQPTKLATKLPVPISTPKPSMYSMNPKVLCSIF